MIKISLCMIVKNEQKNMAEILNNLKPIADEMIVVDTGSADRFLLSPGRAALPMQGISPFPKQAAIISILRTRMNGWTKRTYSVFCV